MRALLAIAVLAAMSLCGVLDKLKQGGDTTSTSNTTQPATKSPPKSVDKEALKAELVKMEEEMTQASLDGDITLLARNTTDDFKITNVDGKVQNKNEALADVKKEKSIKAFSITNSDLQSYSEDSAVLSYDENVTLKNGRSGSARVTDSFVKKDGRWMVKSEQATMIKKR
jgi:hypothetical protein